MKSLAVLLALLFSTTSAFGWSSNLESEVKHISPGAIESFCGLRPNEYVRVLSINRASGSSEYILDTDGLGCVLVQVTGNSGDEVEIKAYHDMNSTVVIGLYTIQ